MNRIKIRYRGPLRGEITTPPDKSISHRAVMLSSIAEGKGIIRNFLHAEDPLSTLNAFRQMGIDIKIQDNEIEVNGRGLTGLREPPGVIECGNSGTTMRLLSGVLAAQPFSTTLTGDASLRSRPMQRIIRPLAQMGADIISEEGGYPPLVISGHRLKPIMYNSPVASAQVKSAILLAGLYTDGITTVTEPGKSRDHTERMLKAMGAEMVLKELCVSVKGRASLKPLDMSVPGDLSSAAFFIVAGLLIPGSEILIRNTGINPTRTGLIYILKKMGADIMLENEREVSGEPVADLIVKHSCLKGVEIGGDLVLKAIDEFPVLCVAASKAEGRTRITGAAELRVKESDRISVMAAELGKMKVNIKELDDGLIIEGRERLDSAVIQSHGDHRIAMSMAIAGLAAEGETLIEDAGCVDTSFPGFMNMLEALQQ